MYHLIGFVSLFIIASFNSYYHFSNNISNKINQVFINKYQPLFISSSNYAIYGLYNNKTISASTVCSDPELCNKDLCEIYSNPEVFTLVINPMFRISPCGLTLQDYIMRFNSNSNDDEKYYYKVINDILITSFLCIFINVITLIIVTMISIYSPAGITSSILQTLNAFGIILCVILILLSKILMIVNFVTINKLDPLNNINILSQYLIHHSITGDIIITCLQLVIEIVLFGIIIFDIIKLSKH
jgi:hypothetical protein